MGQHRKGPGLIGQTIQQLRQFGAVVCKAFAGSGSEVKRTYVLPGFRMFRDGHGPFVAQETCGLLLSRFADTPVRVPGPCALPRVSRDGLPPSGCLKALMGLPNDVFEKQARQLYPTLTNLIASEIAPQEVQNLLSDMFTSRISAMVE